MFIVGCLANFCWRCIAKKVAVVGGAAGVGFGVASLMKERQRNGAAKPASKAIDVDFVVEGAPKPAPPPAPPVAAMKVEFGVDGPDEGRQ